MKPDFFRTFLRPFTSLVKSDFAQNFARDIKSLRALWNWIYMTLYVWICVYAVLYHPDTITTVVSVTGGVVSVIFTGYVLTRTYERTRQSKLSASTPGSPQIEE